MSALENNNNNNLNSGAFFYNGNFVYVSKLFFMDRVKLDKLFIDAEHVRNGLNGQAGRFFYNFKEAEKYRSEHVP